MRHLILGQRQSGKSRLAIYEFMKNYTNSVLVVFTESTVKHVVDTIAKHYKVSDEQLSSIKRRIISVNQDAFRGMPNIDTIIFDEYFYMQANVRAEKLTHAMVSAKNIFVFSTKPAKGECHRKAAKKEILAMEAAGFVIPPTIKSLNPAAHERMKRERQEIRLRRKAEKLGLQLVSKQSTQAHEPFRFNLDTGCDTSVPLGPVSGTTVTRIDPRVPSTLTNKNNNTSTDGSEVTFRPNPGRRAIQGRLKFGDEPTQLSLFD